MKRACAQTTTGSRVAALALVSASWSCASTPQRAHVPPPIQEPAKAEPEKVETLAEASAACDRVQESSKIPISCRTEYVEGAPSMIVGFRDVEEADEWLRPFTAEVSEPFCNAANRNGREAWVYLVVGEGKAQQARRWSCELAKWDEWFATEPEAPPQSVADAIRACQSVQANREVPVTCTTENIDGVPSMIVGFPSEAEVENYAELIGEQVTGPFCGAANRASRRASLYVTLNSAFARQYDCEHQRWGEWFALPERSAPTMEMH